MNDIETFIISRRCDHGGKNILYGFPLGEGSLRNRTDLGVIPPNLPRGVPPLINDNHPGRRIPRLTLYAFRHSRASRTCHFKQYKP